MIDLLPGPEQPEPAAAREPPAGIDAVSITITDVRRAGHCVAGAKAWFDERGFSRDEFRAFLKAGIPAREFWERGDALSHRIVLWKMGLRDE